MVVLFFYLMHKYDSWLPQRFYCSDEVLDRLPLVAKTRRSALRNVSPAAPFAAERSVINLPFVSWQRKLGELPAGILGNDVQLLSLREGFVHGPTRGI